MSRPTCWECGKQLMYVKGKPVWAIIVEDGVEHRVHKDCKMYRERIYADGTTNAQSIAKVDVAKALCTTGCKP